MSWRCSPPTRIRPPWRKDCGSAFSRGSGSPPRSGLPRTCSRRSRSPPGCSTRATSCRISCSWACCCRCGAEPVAQTPGSTPTASRAALVAGASGLVGSHVLRLLLEDPAYARVTVLARRELPLAHKKLDQRVVGFDRLAQIADFPRVHDVFCCLGTTMKQAGSPDAFRKVDCTYVVELARVAVRHRASQFLVVTALGADPRPGIGAERRHHEELRGAVPDGDPGELDDVRAVDLAERIRRSRLLHGRAEAAEYVVHAREIGDLGQAIEAHH